MGKYLVRGHGVQRKTDFMMAMKLIILQDNRSNIILVIKMIW